jgi:hypothetical protein
MIGPLRSRHLALTTALAVLLPLGYIAGLSARVDVPTSDPAHLDVVETGHLIWESAALWGDLPIVTRRWAGGPPPGGNALELDVRADLEKPDLLLYWSAGGAGDTPGLPPDAVLLGPVGGAGVHHFPVPDGRRDEGDLLLYSLGHQEIVGRASMEEAR